METDFGITEYACGHTNTPIPCLLKEMFTDFIVQEILADGTVLPIPSPDLVLESTGAKKENIEIDKEIEKPGCISEETLLALDERFATPGPQVLVLVENLSKEDRKSIHHFVRERYLGKLISETKEAGIVVSHGHTRSSRKRKVWDEKIPSETHFTMSKENKDTSYACQIVAKFLNVPTSSVRTHGIKDKRGVTSQRVSVTQVLEQKILDLNSTLRGIRVFGCEYKNEKLQMGAHWGNRFSIILRGLPDTSEQLLHERLETFQNTGCVNYFGTQRFGSRSSTTAEIGLAIVKRNWEGAVKMILSNALPGNTYAGPVGHAARCFIKTGDAERAFSKLKGAQVFATIEGAILKCLSKGGTWQQCITDSITIQNRSLYVHAYQSILWNKVTSRRVKQFGTRVQANDVGADGQPLGEHATHYDIHIPLPGENEKFANSYGAEWIKELLAADGITPADITALSDRFSLGESSRAVFVESKNLKWKFIHHSNPRDLLQDGLQTRAIPESEQKGPLLALEVQFSLPSGSYATVALREVTGSDMGKKAMQERSNKAKGDVKEEEEEGKGDNSEVEQDEKEEVEAEEKQEE
uniref:TRUD domain-containing protein n=1 Tax=Caenorhabditis japonica TaxID=281687 RepID=A0A8R1DXJ3_CAEJA